MLYPDIAKTLGFSFDNKSYPSHCLASTVSNKHPQSSLCPKRPFLASKVYLTFINEFIESFYKSSLISTCKCHLGEKETVPSCFRPIPRAAYTSQNNFHLILPIASHLFRWRSRPLAERAHSYVSRRREPKTMSAKWQKRRNHIPGSPPIWHADYSRVLVSSWPAPLSSSLIHSLTHSLFHSFIHSLT